MLRHDNIAATFTIEEDAALAEDNIFRGPQSSPGAWITVRDANGNSIPLQERIPMVQDAVSGALIPLLDLDPAETEGAAIFYNYVFDIPGYTTVEFIRVSQYFLYRGTAMINFGGQLIGADRFGSFTIDLSRPVPSFGFYGREHWGTGRGYIFARSFPLFARYWLIGSGPDTFTTSFPNDDLLGKMVTGYANLVVDKAHNFYIQTWITKGGIAALAMIFLFGHYLLTTFVSLIRSKGEAVFTYGLRLGLLASVSAFAVASLATDSTIGSTGVFFVLLGMGYGLNMWVKRNEAPQRH
jgi:hypothetical protein